MFRAALPLAALALLLTGVLGSSSAQPGDPWRERIRGWIASDEVRNTRGVQFDSFASLALTNTPYEGRVRINQPFKSGFANVYLVTRSALTRDYPAAACNCVYVAEVEGVVCDASFVDTFVDTLGRDVADEPSSNGDDEFDEIYEAIRQQELRQFLGYWLFGHELGHLALRHTATPAVDLVAAATSDLDVPVDAGKQYETDADVFMLYRTRFAGDRFVWAMYMGLSQFITSMYAQTVLEQYEEKDILEFYESNPQYDGPWVFAVPFEVEVRATPNKHPGWLLRATSLAQLLVEYHPDIDDNSGYFESVRENIIPSADAPEWFCARPLFDDKVEPGADSGDVGVLAISEWVEHMLADGEPDLALARLEKVSKSKPAADATEKAYVEIIRTYVSALDLDSREALAAFDRLWGEHRQIFESRHDMRQTFNYLRSRFIEIRESDAALEAEILAESDWVAGQFQDDNSDRSISERDAAMSFLMLWEWSSRALGVESDVARFTFQNVLAFAQRSNSNLVLQQLKNVWRSILDEQGEGLTAEDRADLKLGFADAMGMLSGRVDHIQFLEDAYAELSREFPDRHDLLYVTSHAISDQYYGWQQYELAQKSVERAYSHGLAVAEIVRQDQSLPPEVRAHAQANLAMTYNNYGFWHLKTQDFDAAVSLLDMAMAALPRKAEKDFPEQTGVVYQNMAEAKLAAGDLIGAMVAAQGAFSLRVRSNADPHLIEDSRFTLGAALFANGKIEEARVYIAQWQRRMAAAMSFELNPILPNHFIAGKKVTAADILGVAAAEDRMSRIENEKYEYLADIVSAR